MPAKVELPAEYLLIVQAYAAKHGRHWKAQLANDWATGQDYYQDRSGTLRAIRNSPAFGHEWLRTFKLPKS